MDDSDLVPERDIERLLQLATIAPFIAAATGTNLVVTKCLCTPKCRTLAYVPPKKIPTKGYEYGIIVCIKHTTERPATAADVERFKAGKIPLAADIWREERRQKPKPVKPNSPETDARIEHLLAAVHEGTVLDGNI